MIKREISKKIQVVRNRRLPYLTMESSHYHDGFEIYCLTSGNIRYFLDNKIYDLEPGDIILIPPNKLHKTNVTSNTPVERLLISFTSDFLNKTNNDPIFKCFNTPFVSKNEKYNDIITKIENEFHKNDEYAEECVKNLISIFLINLSRVSTNANYTSSTSSLAEKMAKYINNNYYKDISLQLLSDEFSISKNHLSTLFKAETGFCFSEYLNIVRIKSSEHLLISTTMSISEIAFECGFHDSNYFSYVFKKLNEISPLQYRKENSKKNP